MKIVDTPDTPTIDSLVNVLNEKFGSGYTGAQTLKNVLLIADGKNISVLVPGDREVDLKRLEANLPGVKEIRLFEDSDFAKNPSLVKGYVGPQDAQKFGLTVFTPIHVSLQERHGSLGLIRKIATRSMLLMVATLLLMIMWMQRKFAR